jgi:hypothetical protein
MELTKEYLDQKFSQLEEKFITKEYFDQVLDKKLDEKLDQKLDQKLDEKLAKFATKEDIKNFVTKDDLDASLAAQTVELKAYADEQTDFLARIIATSIAEPLERVQRKLSTPFGRQM